MEPFNLFKFVASFFQFLPWVKTVRYAIGIGMIGLVVYRLFMPTTKQVTRIIAQPGSQVMVEQKRGGLRPFVEGYGFTESDSRKGVGAKGGLRWEF